MVTRSFKLSISTEVKSLCAKNPKRTSLKVFNTAGNTVYILSAQDQAYTDGYPVTATIPYEDVLCTDRLWIVASTGTNDVRVIITSE
jgi:hypothetical protein